MLQKYKSYKKVYVHKTYVNVSKNFGVIKNRINISNEIISNFFWNMSILQTRTIFFRRRFSRCFKNIRVTKESAFIKLTRLKKRNSTSKRTLFKIRSPSKIVCFLKNVRITKKGCVIKIERVIKNGTLLKNRTNTKNR